MSDDLSQFLSQWWEAPESLSLECEILTKPNKSVNPNCLSPLFQKPQFLNNPSFSPQFFFSAQNSFFSIAEQPNNSLTAFPSRLLQYLPIAIISARCYSTTSLLQYRPAITVPDRPVMHWKIHLRTLSYSFGVQITHFFEALCS